MYTTLTFYTVAKGLTRCAYNVVTSQIGLLVMGSDSLKQVAKIHSPGT